MKLSEMKTLIRETSNGPWSLDGSYVILDADGYNLFDALTATDRDVELVVVARNAMPAFLALAESARAAAELLRAGAARSDEFAAAAQHIDAALAQVEQAK